MSLDGLPEDHDSLPGIAAPSEAIEVFGHADQADFLARAWHSGKMHHALLFTGEHGIGKASMAFLLARHILSHPDQKRSPLYLDGSTDPDTTRQIAIGAHPQVLHLTRPLDPKTEKFKTQLTIDETRKIGHFLSRTVAGNGWRIVIVDPVNDMNANAANALLKNLEEPTPRTLFILIAHAAGRLLPTIRSRCLQLRFQPLGDDTMGQAMASIGIDQDPGLVAISGGSPRMAAMLSQGGGIEIINAADAVVRNARFDVSAALKIGEALSQREAEPLFLLASNHLVSLLANAAAAAALAGHSGAGRIAELHLAATAKLAEASRFNLDKRQTVLDLLQSVNRAAAATLAG